MEELLSGKDYVVQIDTVTSTDAASGSEANYETIACEISHELTIDKETNQVANKCGGGWRRSTFGNKGWGASAEYHAIDPNTGEGSQVSIDRVAGLAAADVEFWWRRGLIDPNSGKFLPEREGVVKAINYTETSTTEDPLTFSVEWEGQGALILGSTT